MPEFMLLPFDPKPSRELYEKNLKPVFSRFSPVPYLDNRNEFYLQLLNHHVIGQKAS